MSKDKRAKRERRVADLILASVVLEQRWAWERAVLDGLSVPAIRALAPRPSELGGIGRSLSAKAIRGMIETHRINEGGPIYGDRDTRLERRQIELDTLALAARRALVRADEGEQLDKDAAKVLLDVRAAEAKMHGDDAALRIDAEVTHHDGATAELFAMLDEAGVPRPEEVKP